MAQEKVQDLQAWLERQCALLPGVSSAFVMVAEPEGKQLETVAALPAGSVPKPALSNAAVATLRQESGVTRNTDDAALLTCPLRRDGQLVGVAAIELAPRDPIKLRAAAWSLRTGAAWLQVMLRADGSADASADSAPALRLVAGVVEHRAFAPAADAALSGLAAQFGCGRVSIGFRRRGQSHVEAIAGAPAPDGRLALAAALAGAMDESLDQQCAVASGTAGDAPVIRRAHDELVRRHGHGSACSVPFACDGRVAGAITLEHADPARFDAHTVARCETLAALVGPLLWDKYLNERGAMARGKDATRAWTAGLVAPGHWTQKLAVLSLVLLAVVAALVPGELRIRADATLEGSVQRVVTAPLDGYVAEATARPGDVVSAGQLLARLEDRDLVLEQTRLESELRQFEQEYREAMSQLDSSRMRMLRARIDRASAELDLAREKLARARITAPLDGIIVAGDLSQSLGAAMERGEQLFQVAPLTEYRVRLAVDERDIAFLRPGQPGRLVLLGLPGERLPIKVTRITPVSGVEDGRNVFTVEARLESSPPVLRPGMRGVARVAAGERRLAWIWWRRAGGWLRLWAWKWLPWMPGA